MNFFTAFGFASDVYSFSIDFIKKLRGAEGNWEDFLYSIRKIVKATCKDYLQIIENSSDHKEIFFPMEYRKLLCDAVILSLEQNIAFEVTSVLPSEPDFPTTEKERLYTMLKDKLNHSFEYVLRSSLNDTEDQLNEFRKRIDDTTAILRSMHNSVEKIAPIEKKIEDIIPIIHQIHNATEKLDANIANINNTNNNATVIDSKNEDETELASSILKRHSIADNQEYEVLIPPSSSIYNSFIEKLLQHQKNTGEIGKYRDVDIVSFTRAYEDGNKPERKPSVFVTMYTIGLLHKDAKYHMQVKKAINWLYSHIRDDGFFYSTVNAYDPVDNFMGEIYSSYKDSICVYRHSGEALTALLMSEQINNISLKLLLNLINVQNADGGWSNTSANPSSKLFATLFVLQALNHSNLYRLCALLPDEQSELLSNKVSIAKKKALMWLIERNKDCEGLWYAPDVSHKGRYLYTGVIVDAIAELLVTEAPSFASSLAERMINEQINGAWFPDYEKEPDFVSSACMLSAILRLKSFGLDLTIKNIKEMKTKLWDYFGNGENIDAGGLCYAANIFRLDELL